MVESLYLEIQFDLNLIQTGRLFTFHFHNTRLHRSE